MPRDLFAENNITVDQPRDLFSERGINPVQSEAPSSSINLFKLDLNNDKAREKLKQQFSEEAKGAAQSLLNYPIEIANLFKKEPIEKFNFAPKTEAGNVGQIGGDVASFFMPGKALSALKYIPKVNEAINALTKDRTILNSLLKIGKTGGETALYGAAKANEGNKAEAGLESGLLGGGTQAAINLLTTQNPYLRLAARAGLGGTIGSMFGHPAIGAMAGAGLPEGLSLLGLGGKNAVANSVLEGLNPSDVQKAMTANRRLGTTVTPAQASGNYVTSAREGEFKRAPGSAQFAYEQEKMQTKEQQNALRGMLESIYQKTPKNEANINALYKKAEQLNLNPKVIDQMKGNPILEDAFRLVKSNPAFSNIPENNYKFLAEVDRQLSRDYNSAVINKPNTAYAIKQMKSTFNNFLKQVNPDYLAATKAAQPKIVRENIEDALNQHEENYTAKNFYNRFLSKRRNYADILRDTKNFPEARKAIKDMRDGWEHLSNIKTVSQSEAQAKAGISQARDQFKAIIEGIKRYVGATQDIKALKFIYSNDWDKEFSRITQMKNNSERNREFLTLLGKIGASMGLRNEAPIKGQGK